jgi:uncharacterized protein YigE (DUF2233 family)
VTAAAAFTLAALSLATPASGAPAWNRVSAGAEHLHLAEMDAELFRFDLKMFRVEVVVPGRDRRQTAPALRKQHDAVLAVNGGFFDTDARPLGLRVSAKRTVIGLRPRVDWGVLALRGDQAAIVHSREYVPDDRVTDAVQVGPRLLVDGRPLPLKPQSARRTAVALDRSGRFLTIVATRQRVEAVALARALANMGFDRALMLDGGPSTQLSAAIADLQVEIPGGYPVPDGLVVRPR